MAKQLLFDDAAWRKVQSGVSQVRGSKTATFGRVEVTTVALPSEVTR